EGRRKDAHDAIGIERSDPNRVRGRDPRGAQAFGTVRQGFGIDTVKTRDRLAEVVAGEDLGGYESPGRVDRVHDDALDLVRADIELAARGSARRDDAAGEAKRVA